MLGRQREQRVGQEVGEHKIEGLGAAHQGVVEAHGVEDAHAGGDAVEPRVGARHGGGDRVVVDGEDAGAGKGAGGGDRQHAGAAAQVEHALEPACARQPVDGLEAKRGGGVVAGAERLAGLDLDGVAPHRKARPVVAGVHDEAAGANRRQGGLR